MPVSDKTHILGGLTPTQFLRDYWQKKPLLIRQAFPNFEGFLTKKSLIALCSREETQSRLVNYDNKQWSLEQGPFSKRDFAKLLGHWALLVQDVNYFYPEAETLLENFNFIPHARLDDLMVSYAPDGGGVGPHFDSYDVFLLQGSGKRLWQISKQKNLDLLPNTPLKILKNFKPQQEWLLEPGDMLYLPPNYSHHGIAVGECMTYSIGFRAPSYQELMGEFLFYLQDHIKIDGIYADPELKINKNPAQIPTQMINKVAKILEKIRFNKKDIANFLGEYLSEPKATVFFEPPEVALSKKEFFKLATKLGICLNPKSQMLFTDKNIFMNGEKYSFSGKIKFILQELANLRKMVISAEDMKEIGNLLYQWYLDGYLHIML